MKLPLLLCTSLLGGCSDNAQALPTAQACISFIAGSNPLFKPIDSRISVENSRPEQTMVISQQHTYCKVLTIGDYTLHWRAPDSLIEHQRNFTMRASGIHVTINLNPVTTP